MSANAIFNHQHSAAGISYTDIAWVGYETLNGSGYGLNYFGQKYPQCTGKTASGEQCRHIDRKNPMQWRRSDSAMMIRNGDVWHEIPPGTWILSMQSDKFVEAVAFRCPLHYREDSNA